MAKEVKYAIAGTDLTSALGLEDKMVIRYWDAFHSKMYIVCDVILKLKGFK